MQIITTITPITPSIYLFKYEYQDNILEYYAAPDNISEEIKSTQKWIKEKGLN